MDVNLGIHSAHCTWHTAPQPGCSRGCKCLSPCFSVSAALQITAPASAVRPALWTAWIRTCSPGQPRVSSSPIAHPSLPPNLFGSQVLSCSYIVAPSLWALLPLSWLSAEHKFSMKNDLHNASMRVMDFAGGLERWKRVLTATKRTRHCSEMSLFPKCPSPLPR